MSKDVIFMYETFINGEDGAAAKKAKLNLDPDKHKSIGFIGKVEEYRSKLEDLFKSS